MNSELEFEMWYNLKYPITPRTAMLDSSFKKIAYEAWKASPMKYVYVVMSQGAYGDILKAVCKTEHDADLYCKKYYEDHGVRCEYVQMEVE